MIKYQLQLLCAEVEKTSVTEKQTLSMLTQLESHWMGHRRETTNPAQDNTMKFLSSLRNRNYCSKYQLNSSVLTASKTSSCKLQKLCWRVTAAFLFVLKPGQMLIWENLVAWAMWLLQSSIFTISGWPCRLCLPQVSVRGGRNPSRI